MDGSSWKLPPEALTGVAKHLHESCCAVEVSDGRITLQCSDEIYRMFSDRIVSDIQSAYNDHLDGEHSINIFVASRFFNGDCHAIIVGTNLNCGEKGKFYGEWDAGKYGFCDAHNDMAESGSYRIHPEFDSGWIRYRFVENVTPDAKH